MFTFAHIKNILNMNFTKSASLLLFSILNIILVITSSALIAQNPVFNLEEKELIFSKELNATIKKECHTQKISIDDRSLCSYSPSNAYFYSVAFIENAATSTLQELGKNKSTLCLYIIHPETTPIKSGLYTIRFRYDSLTKNWTYELADNQNTYKQINNLKHYELSAQYVTANPTVSLYSEKQQLNISCQIRNHRFNFSLPLNWQNTTEPKSSITKMNTPVLKVISSFRNDLLKALPNYILPDSVNPTLIVSSSVSSLICSNYNQLNDKSEITELAYCYLRAPKINPAEYIFHIDKKAKTSSIYLQELKTNKKIPVHYVINNWREFKIGSTGGIDKDALLLNLPMQGKVKNSVYTFTFKDLH